MGDGYIEMANYNADWLKTKWTWPEYKTKEFYDRLEEEGLKVRDFQEWQMYIGAVRSGLIINDEWTGVEANWTTNWMVDEFVLEDQIIFRTQYLFESIKQILAEAQAEANRALTQAETGNYLLDFISRSTVMSILKSDVTVTPAADITGIDGLEPVDQQDAWMTALLNYSDAFVTRILENRLPQIWKKKGARAVYYPRRNLIVVPGVNAENVQLLAHAVAHYIEGIGMNREAVEMARNSIALPGPLHMIRHSLYSLRGPWLDQQEGALRGHDQEQLEKWYTERKEFTEDEIERTFVGNPTEYFSMSAQRIVRGDPVEISNMWSRQPMQLLLYVALISGNFMEAPDAV